MATAAPSRKRRSAMARPIPRVPPVTAAIFPESASIPQILPRPASYRARRTAAPYADSASSAVNRTSFSTCACATSIRSKGSRWRHGSREDLPRVRRQQWQALEGLGGQPLGEVARQPQFSQALFEPDLPQRDGAHEYRVLRVADQFPGLRGERRAVVQPPEQNVRIEQNPQLGGSFIPKASAISSGRRVEVGSDPDLRPPSSRAFWAGPGRERPPAAPRACRLWR